MINDHFYNKFYYYKYTYIYMKYIVIIFLFVFLLMQITIAKSGSLFESDFVKIETKTDNVYETKLNSIRHKINLQDSNK